MKRTTKYIGWAIILIICLWGSVNFSKEQVRVQMILNNMKNEIERDMKLMGCKSIKDLSRSNLRFR